MKLRLFIQWGFLVFLIVILMVFEKIHLQVSHFNVFLFLLISFTFIEIVAFKVLETRRPSVEKGDQQGETKA
jgi:hypothetical protein